MPTPERLPQQKVSRPQENSRARNGFIKTVEKAMPLVSASLLAAELTILTVGGKKGREKQTATNPDQIERAEQGLYEEPAPGSRQAQRRHNRFVESASEQLVKQGGGTSKQMHRQAEKIIDEKQKPPQTSNE